MPDHPRFIQIATAESDLYALDEEGTVWHREGGAFWQALANERSKVVRCPACDKPTGERHRIQVLLVAKNQAVDVCGRCAGLKGKVIPLRGYIQNSVFEYRLFLHSEGPGVPAVWICELVDAGFQVEDPNGAEAYKQLLARVTKDGRIKKGEAAK